MMKKTIILTIVLTGVIQLAAQGQEYRLPLANSGDKTIEFTTSQSEIIVEGHDSDELVIRNLDYDPPPERANGLRALYNSTEDNTGIGLSVEEEGNTVKIVQASNTSGEFRMLIPNKARILIEEINWGGGDIEVHNHNGEIEIRSKNGDILLQHITGPVIASSTSGDVEAVFSRINQDTPTSISVVSGYVDITLPADSKAAFYMKSTSGEIYTDLNLELRDDNSNSMRRLGGGRNIEATLNGGGVEMELKSVSGDIYLRKSTGQ